MSLFPLLLAAAASLPVASLPPAIPQPATLGPAAPAPAGSPLIAPATIDNNLEISGEELEAEQLKKRLFIEVKVNDNGPHRFLVDSGADRSVVSEGLALRLALPAGESVKVQGMAGAVSVATVEVAALALGQSEVGPITAPALPARHLGADGLIGIDALADQRLMLDFDKRTVTVQDSRQPYTSMGGEILVTAKRRKGQLIITQASVRGRPVAAVIDTGSELTLGNQALRERLFGTRIPNGMREIELISVTGQVLKAQAVVLDDVRIGGLMLNNVLIAFADAPPFALFGLSEQPAIFLGSDLLASFRRVSLDFRNRKVRFTLRPGSTLRPFATVQF
ncbi:aspartyl protease family protein [Sandarakinorhabdus rubra]|uniref:aspartyl protease family protein n=1 Tax=Sandarakinorhabdus rubra TaxID=2672568 RepID=UPI0013DD5DBA|nr:aspartyl protease family protein [Sandarakinorhabdus rubra]